VRKAAVVAPYEVVVAGRDQFDSIAPQVPEITKIVNAELRAMADEGCPNVQLDAPIFGGDVNMGTMTAQQAADLIAPCFEGVKAKRSLHFCNGNLRGKPISHSLHAAPWVDILERLDGVVDVACFELKYFFQWIERDSFKRMPKNMHLAAGLVDEGSYWIESPGKIRNRLADWARVVGEERLWVSPSCGFGRHPARSIPVLRAKVENMVEAARTL
jgi:methionine synthase II (cobalamin-independent)